MYCDRICAISLTRLYYNSRTTYMVTNFTEYAGIAAILGALEANLSIICACLPAFPALLKPLVERFRSSLGSGRPDSLRGFFEGFSVRPGRRHTRGSVKLGSSGDAPGPDDPPAPGGVERARHAPGNTDHTDKLYPLRVASATRVSVEGERAWSDLGRVRVQTNISAETMEMARLDGRMEAWGNVRC